MHEPTAFQPSARRPNGAGRLFFPRPALTLGAVAFGLVPLGGCVPDCPVERPEAAVTLALEGMAAEVDAPEQARVTVDQDRAEVRGDDNLWMHIERGKKDVVAVAEDIRTRHPGIPVTHVQAWGGQAMEFTLGRRHHFVAVHARGELQWSCWSDERGRFSELDVMHMRRICASVRTLDE